MESDLHPQHTHLWLKKSWTFICLFFLTDTKKWSSQFVLAVSSLLSDTTSSLFTHCVDLLHLTLSNLHHLSSSWTTNPMTRLLNQSGLRDATRVSKQNNCKAGTEIPYLMYFTDHFLQQNLIQSLLRELFSLMRHLLCCENIETS